MRRKKYYTIVIGCLMTISIVQDAPAFSLKKLIPNIAPAENQDSGSSGTDNTTKGGFGSLLGSLKPPVAGPGSTSGTASILDLGLEVACPKKKLESALYSDAGPEQIANWSKSVALDFGFKPNLAGASNTATILIDNFGNDSGLGWSKSLGFYLDAFEGTKIKPVFQEFILKSELRLEIAAKIRNASSDSEIGRKNRRDAKLAYALILGHFFNDVKNKGAIENFIKSAEKDNSIGALYVIALRRYKGFGVQKNVDRSYTDILNPIQIMEQEKAEAEERGDTFDTFWWDEPEKLSFIIQVDPEYSDHKANQQWAARADKVRADIQAQIDKGAGGGKLGSEIKRLEKLRAGQERLIAEAFGLSKELAEKNEALLELKQMSLSDGQIVEKTVAISDEANKNLTDAIAANKSQIGPEGIKKATLAQKSAKYVATEAFKLGFGTFLSNPAGDFGSMAATVKSVEFTRELSCRLNSAIEDYKKNSEIAFTDEGPLEMGSDEEKLLLGN